MYDKFEKFGLNDYPPEIRGRFNSFITTQFDDSLSVEMQIRSIIKWANDNFYEVISQTNHFIDFINDLIEYMNNFIETFDDKYQETILDKVQEWYDNGELETLINESLDTKYHEMDQRLTEQLTQIAVNVKNIEELKTVNILTEHTRALIAKPIHIDEDLVLNEHLTLDFSHNGQFVIGDGVTLTLNSLLDVGYQHIFEFESDTSRLTTSQTNFGTELSPPKANYNIKVEWFGAVADGYPTDKYLYEPVSGAYGTDNLQAFKRAQSFVEECSSKSGVNPNRHIHPTVFLELKPHSSYYVKGHNPFGIQSTIPDIGYSVGFDGKHSTIIWEPTRVSDALFAKYGRVVRANVSNLNVVLVGVQGTRWGSFIDSRTGENDQFHIWNTGVIKNLRLATHSSVGFDKIFNIRTDQLHSHDDITLVENVVAMCYNTFLNLENREAVTWKLDKCQFVSNTTGAKHIIIADNHAGGLTIDSPDILLRETNEVFLQVGDNVSSTPTRIINGRMETRNQVPMTFIDAKSSNIVVDNLQFVAGNDVPPHVDTRTAKLGEKAYIRFEDCFLYSQFDVNVSNVSGQKQNALSFMQCSFKESIRSTARTLGYPTINYMVGGVQKTIAEVIKQGMYLRKISVHEPTATDGGFVLPIIYPARGSNPSNFTTELFKLKADGNPHLAITGLNSLPPNIVITDVRLFGGNIDTTKVDEVRIDFYEDRDNPGANATILNYSFPDNNPIVNVSLLNDDILSIPNRNYMNVSMRKDDVTVPEPSLHPNSWLEITYRAISKRTDFLSDDTRFGRKSVVTSY